MVPASKHVIMIDQISATNGEAVTGNCDTIGFAFASIDVVLPTSDSTANNPSAFNLLESDDTVVSNFATVSGFVGDTDWTIPVADISNSTAFKFNVNLLGRKRFLRLSITPTTTMIVKGAANLHRASETPINTTKAGVVALVEG